jgi:hypothetical protein
VNNPSIPDVTLPASDHRRLERLAQVGADHGDVGARFLLKRSTVRKSSLIAQPDWTALSPWGRG